MSGITYPGARRPDRRRGVSDHGLQLSVWEWGDEGSPPLLLAHGGFDFAGTYDVFAPLLADAGWRVVSWDQRGHGDSDHAVLYSWDSDVRDALAVLDSTTRRPIPFIGHSKGGSVVMQLAEALPHRCTHLVNLDGLPSRRSWPDVPDHERTRLLAGEVRAWLDHRASASDKERKPGTIDELAQRRQRMNPRLTLDWLRYLVTIGGREVGPDQWRWKLDPIMRFGGFGPWRPEWSMMRMPGLAMPVLGVLGLVGETMGWGTQPEDVARFLPPGGTVVPMEDSGHFVHIEHPRRIADLVLDFVGPAPTGGGSWGPVGVGEPASRPAPEITENPAPVVRLRHARSDLALHELRGGEGRALLLLHGLAERSPAAAPAYLDEWPGPIHALDFVGHGASTVPSGGGYTAEMLLADADTALRYLGEATVLGRGLGAYIALLLAGARPDAVCGAILFDGPGILGGGTGPGPSVVAAVDSTAPAPPDPFALADLSRDIRPPDYATNFVRLATQSSPLEYPIAVASINRPDWLEAVGREPGVLSLTLSEALATYAGA
ncbi:MAG TPA: alpha/beta hydrolase [Acidimicrobiales bacterium]|jgi:pimeloyl-ACP methyl ester carboxylesterase|nr:alpha/beta hydrolase [Acidimicrobiales bacterium]